MAAHHRKAIRELEHLGYTRTEDVPGFPVWKMAGHGPVAIDVTSNKSQMDTFIAGIRRAHQKPPKPDTDVVSRVSQAEFDARERDRKQRERATYLATKDRRLGGAAKGLPEWMVDQLDAAAESVIRRDLELRRLMTQRPYADVAD
jgi:hypothetical protein